MNNIVLGNTKNILLSNDPITITKTYYELTQGKIFDPEPLDITIEKKTVTSYTVNFLNLGFKFLIFFDYGYGGVDSNENINDFPKAPEGTLFTAYNTSDVKDRYDYPPIAPRVVLKVFGETTDSYYTIDSNINKSNGNIIDVKITLMQGKNLNFNNKVELISTSNIKYNFTTKIDESSCVSVPIIRITGQTLSEGSDLGNAKFAIIDKYQYYHGDYIPDKDNKCGVYNVNVSELKKTILEINCPAIILALVTKGTGNTWYDKTESIYLELGEEKIGTGFNSFRERLLLYSLLKLLLARILYNEFNIKYLLRKYNEKFIKDLGKSRFCEVLHVFLDLSLIHI